MYTEEEWKHSLIHKCFQIDDTENLKVGGFVDSGEGTQLYIIIDVMEDYAVMAIKHTGVIH